MHYITYINICTATNNIEAMATECVIAYSATHHWLLTIRRYKVHISTASAKYVHNMHAVNAWLRARQNTKPNHRSFSNFFLSDLSHLYKNCAQHPNTSFRFLQLATGFTLLEEDQLTLLRHNDGSCHHIHCSMPRCIFSFSSVVASPLHSLLLCGQHTVGQLR